MQLSEAISLLQDYLHQLLAQGGSDLFITAGFPPAIKCKGEVIPLTEEALSTQATQALTRCMMNERQLAEFVKTRECNFALAPEGLGRFRVNAYMQQGCEGLVIRVIASEIPTIEGLGLPEVIKQIMLSKYGLIIMVGATGCGKSTSMAAMIDYRNAQMRNHIILLEDPIEFVHQPKQSVIMQREIGVDTDNWEIALQNTLRQAPDVIVLGEIRNAAIMSYCLELAQTGHLVLATLHANNANQAIDRVLGFFDTQTQHKLMQDISVNLRAVISQRLVKTLDNQRCLALEILLNTPLVQESIAKGEAAGLKPVMMRSRELGMQTFDQALFDLYDEGKISYEEALRNADSYNELRLKIKLAEGTPSANDFSLKAMEENDSD
jgi:twitching motility protein PilU